MSDEVACEKYGRKDLMYQNWRWKPNGCDLPRFDGKVFLEKLRNKRMVYVGDSLNRNDWVSMVCMVESFVPLHQKSLSRNGSLISFKAKEFNASIDFYWSPLLVESNCDHLYNHRVSSRIIRSSSIKPHAKNWMNADILVFNSYLWWRKPNMKMQVLYDPFGEDRWTYTEVEMREGFQLALDTWSNWLQFNTNTSEKQIFFVSLSPTHALGEDWGSASNQNCYKETEPITKEGFRGSGSDYRIAKMVEITIENLRNRGVKVQILNITQLSEYRKDAHPSIYRKFWGNLSDEQIANPSSYSDCIHWCLPERKKRKRKREMTSSPKLAPLFGLRSYFSSFIAFFLVVFSVTLLLNQIQNQIPLTNDKENHSQNQNSIDQFVDNHHQQQQDIPRLVEENNEENRKENRVPSQDHEIFVRNEENQNENRVPSQDHATLANNEESRVPSQDHGTNEDNHVDQNKNPSRLVENTETSVTNEQVISNGGAGDSGEEKAECNYSIGRWVYDNASRPLYNGTRCKFMHDEVACDKYGRKDLMYQKWRWQPNSCDLPRFDAVKFLEKIRGKRMVFVGDSLNRNQWVSMVCLVESVVAEEHKTRTINESLMSFKIQNYNVSIDFYWSPLLVESNCDDPIIHRVSSRIMRAYRMDKHAKNWMDADIIVFNSYLWWKKPNMKMKVLYGSFTDGDAVVKDIDMFEGFELVMKSWSQWLEKNLNNTNKQMFFVSLSPTHVWGQEWGAKPDDTCYGETEPVYKEGYKSNGSDYRMLHKAEETIENLKTKGVNVQIVNISQLSEYRKDGHPSIYRRQYVKLSSEQIANPKSYSDCTHWCLPGVPDVWNEFLYAYIVS
ncbi:hypothetical protein LUZ60_015378 [Juncus effusus]|nr:hypothetical protein LUZ60_015378 [Juncus effusus]